MGGSAGLPLGPGPVVRDFTRAGEVLCQPLTGSMGWKSNTASFSHFPSSSLAPANFGVWPPPHLVTSITRYFPRATLPDSANPSQAKASVETIVSLRAVINVNDTTRAEAQTGIAQKGGRPGGRPC